MADVRLRMLDLIDRLKQLAENANKVPLSSRILLDGQALKQTLQQLEDSVDPDIRNAVRELVSTYQPDDIPENSGHNGKELIHI